MVQQIDTVGRTVVSTPAFGFCALAPIILLLFLAIRPIDAMSTKVKQMISLPLLTSLLYVPYRYCDAENGTFSVFCQLIPFVMFLRFIDVFWITPLIYKKEAYMPASEFGVELLSSIKRDLKPHREKTKNKKVVPIKDQKFYYLFTPIILNAVAFDTLAVWAKTFSEKDLLFMQKNNFLLSFIFFFVVVNALTCLLNFGGKVLQLLYCITVDHGSYSSDDWRLMMNYPLLALSMEEVWSSRWHRILRPAWVASAYKPVYFIMSKLTRGNSKYKILSIGLASMAVFVVSGMTHEYVALCNTGWKLYKKTFIGDQMVFFCSHGVIVVLERIAKFIYTKVLRLSFKNTLIVRILLHVYVLYTCFIFFPYFINAFAYWGLWKLDNITPLDGIIRHYLVTTPYLHQFCGSLLK